MWAMSTNRIAPTPWAIVGHPLEVPQARIGRRAADDELRAGPRGPGPPSRRSRSARCPRGRRTAWTSYSRPEKLRAMPWVRWPPWARFMPRIRSPGCEDAEVGGHVGLGARVRLDVDVLRTREQRERALLGEPLGDVDVLAAAVVALAGQALGVLVRQPRALGLHDRGRDVVLARDELDLVVLAAPLAEHRLPQDGVDAPRSTRARRPAGGEIVMARRLLPAAPGPPHRAAGAPEPYLPTNEGAVGMPDPCRDVHPRPD